MDLLIPLTFVISFVASIVSGMGGGGGGFIVMPYLLFIGLDPAHAIATAKMGGIGSTVGSVAVFRGTGLINKRLVLPFLLITIVCACISAFLIPKIDSTLFQKAIGVVLIVLIPTLFIKKASLQPGERPKLWIIVGFILYVVFAFMQTLVGTGMGSILVLILMFAFGLSALSAQATKRVAQISQSIILFVLLLIQGLVVVAYGAALIAGSLLGAHVGTKIAIKKGNRFAKFMLAVVMGISGVVLLLT